jgi:hypothetical protein
LAATTENKKLRKDLAQQIKKRRRQCLIHRFLYYVKAEPLISDAQYDVMERELKALVAAHPEIERDVEYTAMCPSRVVGSSNLDDYPREIEQIAESLLAASKPKPVKIEETSSENEEVRVVHGHERPDVQ